MKTPHVHADLIKQWADGAEIEVYWDSDKMWSRTETPLWVETVKYRVKPQNEIRYGLWIPNEAKLYCNNKTKDPTDTVKITLNENKTKIIAIELLPTTE